MKTNISAGLDLMLRSYFQLPESQRLQHLNEMITLRVFKDFSPEELIAASRSSPYLSTDQECLLLLEVALAAGEDTIFKSMEGAPTYERGFWFGKALGVMNSVVQLEYFNCFGVLSPEERGMLFKRAVAVLDSAFHLKYFNFFGELSSEERGILFKRAMAVMDSAYQLEDFNFFGVLSPEERTLLFNKAVTVLYSRYDLKYFELFEELSPEERTLLFNKAIELVRSRAYDDYYYSEPDPDLDPDYNLEYFKFFGKLSPQEMTILRHRKDSLGLRCQIPSEIRPDEGILSVCKGFWKDFFS